MSRYHDVATRNKAHQAILIMSLPELDALVF